MDTWVLDDNDFRAKEHVLDDGIIANFLFLEFVVALMWVFVGNGKGLR